MKKEFIRASKVFLVFSLICSVVYPFIVWLAGITLFYHESRGSLVKKDGKIIGSELIAQSFFSAKYFHPRPSYAGQNGYDATSSSASNLAPTAEKLIVAISDRVNQYRDENSMSKNQTVPQDAVTASASGLDPHISVSNAIRQSHRISKERNINIEDVINLINICIEKPMLGFFGEKRVNVIKLNFLLDQKTQ